MFDPKHVGARLGVRGTLECRNARGEVIKTIEVNGSIPLTQLGLTEDQARELVQQQENQAHGTDHRN